MIKKIETADKDLSIIIPSRNDRPQLLRLLSRLSELPIECFELLIIDSSDTKERLPNSFTDLFEKKPFKMRHIFISPAFPGAARNEGVYQSRTSWIAFLDTKTYPNEYWIEVYKDTIFRNIYDGIWGRTQYKAVNGCEKVIVATTYGFKNVYSVPGMIIKKNKFFEIGNFIPSLRAGEDTDWMLRLSHHPISLFRPTRKTMDYYGIADLSFMILVKKWFKNYKACGSMHYLKDHRIVYLAFFNILTLLIVLNWNATVANWDTNSNFFVPNISKITAGLIFTAYFLVRAIFLPLIRGCSVKFLISGNCLLIFCLAVVIDCIKFCAFFPSLKAVPKIFKIT